MNSKLLALLLIGLGFVVIVVSAIAIRSRRTEQASVRPAAKPPQPQAVASADMPNRPKDVVVDVPVKPLPPPAPPSESVAATKVVLVKSSLMLYRRAVQKGNKAGQDSLLAALKRDKELALKIAREELSAATSDKVKKSLSDAIQAIQE